MKCLKCKEEMNVFLKGEYGGDFNTYYVCMVCDILISLWVKKEKMYLIEEELKKEEKK